jgi:hypothetical protein
MMNFGDQLVIFDFVSNQVTTLNVWSLHEGSPLKVMKARVRVYHQNVLVIIFRLDYQSAVEVLVH